MRQHCALPYGVITQADLGALGWLLAQTDALARSAGIENYAPVLFGGVLASVFSILQFVFAPFWGALSDRRGRRGVDPEAPTGRADRTTVRGAVPQVPEGLCEEQQGGQPE